MEPRHAGPSVHLLRSLVSRVRRGAIPTVTACIPAWQSESFIERTLDCVCAQTHERLRILISIDRGDDETSRICARHARQDPRIRVFEQPERLGWARNVNFLLDRVDTEYFFLYFHDDLIVPDYTRRLLAKLDARPDAMSVHCDMGHFGGSDHVSQGVEYSGKAAQRLFKFLVAPVKGSPLRKSDPLRPPRFRRASAYRGPRWTVGEPAVSDGAAGRRASPACARGALPALGPALGGTHDGWRRFSLEEVISGYRVNVAKGAEIVSRIAEDEGERELLTFGLYLYFMTQIRWRRSRLSGLPHRFRPNRSIRTSATSYRLRRSPTRAPRSPDGPSVPTGTFSPWVRPAREPGATRRGIRRRHHGQLGRPPARPARRAGHRV